MFDLALFAALLVTALLVAWTVNGLVGLLSGDRPRDTASLWADVFARMFLFLEFGVIGRILNSCGVSGWRRKLVLFVGLFCVLLFLAKAARDAESDHTHTYHYTNTVPVRTQ